MNNNILIVVDMQNDFILPPLGTPEAEAIVPKVAEKIYTYKGRIIFTQDTHFMNYFDTLEGKYLPIEHCICGTEGWHIHPDIPCAGHEAVIKTSFGHNNWELGENINSIELVGVCTDICVVSNALILRSLYPNTKIIVDASCCAGTTPERHKAALEVMKSCQIDVISEE